MSQTLEMLSLDDLRESDLNPRRHFGEASLTELAENIRQVGVLTPLLVRPFADAYEIAGGHRRYRAAQRAGLAEVPCIVRELTDSEFLEIVTLDNLHREDVHPLDEAQGYAILLAHNELEIEALAAKVGKSVSYIYQRLKLRDLIPEAQTAFLADEITAGHAILLARLAPAEQKEYLEECVTVYEPLSVRALADQIRRHVYLDLSKAPFPTDDATLWPEAGSCVECPKRTGYNTQLFPDIAEADTCTDKVCHARKMNAWLAAKATKGKCTVRITPRSYGQVPEGITKNWRPAGKETCPDTQKALVVEDGWHEGKDYKIGATVKVCTNKKCAVHNAEAIRQRVEQKGARKEIGAKRAAEREAQEQAKEAALQATAAAVRAREDVPDAAWRLVGKMVVQGSYSGHRDIVKTLGLTLGEDEDYEEKLVTYLQELTGATLIQTVLVMLATDIQADALNFNGNVEPFEQAFLDEYPQTSAKPKRVGESPRG